MSDAINYHLQFITGKSIPVKKMAYSLCLLYFLTKANTTAYKLLMIDLQILKVTYVRKELRDVVLSTPSTLFPTP